MTANIAIKLNDGQAFVFEGVDTYKDLYIGGSFIGIMSIDQDAMGRPTAENQFRLELVKEILIKPMAQDPVDWEDTSKRQVRAIFF